MSAIWKPHDAQAHDAGVHAQEGAPVRVGPLEISPQARTREGAQSFPFDAAMPLSGALAPDQAKLAELKRRTFRGDCPGITKAGTRCGRHVVFANGKCKAHGGKNPPEYIAGALARLKHNAERKQRRAARRARKAALADGLRIVKGGDGI